MTNYLNCEEKAKIMVSPEIILAYEKSTTIPYAESIKAISFTDDSETNVINHSFTFDDANNIKIKVNEKKTFELKMLSCRYYERLNAEPCLQVSISANDGTDASSAVINYSSTGVFTVAKADEIIDACKQVGYDISSVLATFYQKVLISLLRTNLYQFVSLKAQAIFKEDICKAFDCADMLSEFNFYTSKNKVKEKYGELTPLT